MINTNNYPYYKLPFEYFNPVQEAVYPFFTEDCNFVISSTLSSGKTAIAECVMGYELSRGTVAYVCPLKALLRQQYESWKDTELARYGITLFSSDEKSSEQINKLIIATIESFDVKVRKKSAFVKEMSCFVFDEAHLLGHSKRGADAEALMMGLAKANKNCRIVFLSGTLSNANEIAKWLKGLNGKETKCVKSNWTPCKVDKNVIVAEDKEKMLDFISKKIEASEYEKILIFVHSKKQGEMIVRYLLDSGVNCAFYHADLDRKRRDKIAGRFRDENSGLDVMCSTSALSLGLNL